MNSSNEGNVVTIASGSTNDLQIISRNILQDIIDHPIIHTFHSDTTPLSPPDLHAMLQQEPYTSTSQSYHHPWRNWRPNMHNAAVPQPPIDLSNTPTSAARMVPQKAVAAVPAPTTRILRTRRTDVENDSPKADEPQQQKKRVRGQRLRPNDVPPTELACRHCDKKILPDDANILTHFKEHCPKPPKRVQCPVQHCVVEVGYHQLRRHILSTHFKKTARKCPNCLSIVTRADALKRHRDKCDKK